MALILRGKSRCALCDEVLEEGEELFATSAFLSDEAHPLWRYSDAAMHLSCFRDWPDREAFVAEFNSFWAHHFRGMRFMHSDGTIEEREPQPRGTA